jgi:hypothetical protein
MAAVNETQNLVPYCIGHPHPLFAALLMPSPLATSLVHNLRLLINANAGPTRVCIMRSICYDCSG